MREIVVTGQKKVTRKKRFDPLKNGDFTLLFEPYGSNLKNS